MPEASAKLTIRDVARLAGVSRSTVSLVINGDPRISGETKARVLEVIEKSGYQPNSMARSLARRRSDTVAVVLPDTGSHVFTDTYFGEAISGISSALSEQGYRLLIQIATPYFEEHGLHTKLVREAGVDGMLLVGTLDEDAYVGELVKAGVHLVMVNSRYPGAGSVTADNRAGSRAMVKHLVSLGHRRIGFIGGLENTTVGADRSAGFLAGMNEAGLAVDDALRLWGNFSEASGAEAARKLLAVTPRPTALMAANDMMAIGALRVAQEELGLKVPRDLTVVGADNIGLTTYIRPRLTTVSQPIFEIGRQATEVLLQGIAGDAGKAQITLETKVLVRDSSGPPPA